MTLQQEIVEALNQAADDHKLKADISGSAYGKLSELHRVKLYRNLAARVENARCETCKKYFMATSKDMEGIPCPWAGSGGCWNYEPKEEVNL